MINIQEAERIRDFSLFRFQELAKAKYDKGQAEHGGIITDRCLVDELENEIIDLWFYVSALKLKLIALDNKQK